MSIHTEANILQVIKEDEWMMQVIKAAQSLLLPDWWVCAGFVRSKIWDILHEFDSRTGIPDVDVIYFDLENTDERKEKILEEKLKKLMPEIPWSVKNQARMHHINNLEPYTSAVDGISKFPETVTSIGVKIDENNQLILTAPWGITDLIQLQVKPTPFFAETPERLTMYKNRVQQKNWKSTWKKVTIE